MRRMIRFVTAAFLLVPILSGLPAHAQQTEKAKSLGKRLLCVCGCNQILTECNHIGCSMSTEMLKKLDQQVARNEPEDLTIQAFVQEYGERVLAQPAVKGFSLAAWIMPGAAGIIGLVIVFTVLRLWRRPPRRVPAQAAPSIPPELLARGRRQADLESEE